MKPRLARRLPALLAAGIILAVCLLRIGRLGLFEQLEWKTFDWRARVATRLDHPTAPNLGFVFMDDESIAAVNRGLLGSRYGLYWPRHVYGRLVRELSAQHAAAVAFDVLFAELRPDQAAIPVRDTPDHALEKFLQQLHPGGKLTKLEGAIWVESDDFFAWQLHRAGNVIVAAEKEVPAHDLFRANAFQLGDISAEKDADGVLRRARAYRTYRHWHPLFLKAASEYGLDLSRARREPHQIILPQAGGDVVRVPLDTNGCFAPADFVGAQLAAGLPPRAKPYTDQRVWQMGIVLAAEELKLDLAHAEVDPRRGRITLHGPNGVRRVIPIDADVFFYINWELPPTDPRVTKESIASLLRQDLLRAAGDAAALTNRWRDKLVVVGSSATGNDLTDRGATPLEKDALLVSKHWNVANAVLTGRFVQRSPLAADLALIALLGLSTALLTWRLRPLTAAASVLVLAGAWCAACVWIYVEYRWWLPLVLPVLGALLVEHVGLLTYRVVFEERERRRVRSFFTRLVSPNIVQELLAAEELSLGGARREITVLFADVRGFTELTDRSDEAVATRVRQEGLRGAAAEALFDQQARETLQTVNLYLATVADIVKRHEGTLDKFIGDCVMAFWGAPTANPRHALAGIHAAMDAQRAIHELNRQRSAENQRREQESAARVAIGQTPLTPLPLLLLGSGINTGWATVGLMGSEAHIVNYTVFGREVNLASRLESLSGRGRIVIGQATFEAVQRDDPALAARCLALPPATVKGIRGTVTVYEVPWRADGEGAATAAMPGADGGPGHVST